MSAEPIPLRPDWPDPGHNLTDDEQRRWWLAYNAGHADGAQSILDLLGITPADLDTAADAVTLADTDRQLARSHRHLSIAT